ncbi:Gfo/Idh/MocA family oxidoreductase [Pasteurellaceae bacterium LIM206]|nr:Gfo/Idh/MocA family oxidoreductase [Pasteurellaceae bacterium LIM206]
MVSPIRVAIAGAGYSTRVFHAPFLRNDPHFAVKKVYERRTDRAKDYFEQVEIVREFEQLLTDEIDLVIITTPNQTHYEFAKASLMTGKHVLVEKPLTTTQQQALELAEIAKANGVILSVYQNRRWDNAVVTAAEILRKGLLGKIVDCEIRFDRYAKAKNTKAWKESGEKGTGLVYDLGVHLLDQAVYLFGKPQAIAADVRAQHEDSLVDDNFNIQLYYADGLRVQLSAGKYVREAGNHFAMHGKLGSYVKKTVDNQEELLTKGEAPVGDWNLESEEKWGILHTELNGRLVREPYPNVKTGYADFYRNLALAINGEAVPAVTADQAAYILWLIEKVYESAMRGVRLSL